MKGLAELTKKIQPLSKKDEKRLAQSYSFAKQAHKGQTRYSGEPYFNHVYETASLLADMGMSVETVIAGLLHDTIEDAEVTDESISSLFGEEVLFLVKGVTKLGKIRYHGVERHVGSLRKLFLATSSDLRVLIIKLADRLHNMRTLEHVPEEKQRRIALETMEVYAPIAHRLGMGKLMGELQDLSFPYVYPEDYVKVKELAEQKRKEKTAKLKELYKELEKSLKKEKVSDITIDYRLKHMYSIYEKLKRKDWDINRVYDISALRIIVPTVSDCYKVLGVVHGIWRPLPGRIKDYIAFPKPNGYQSIHTTIFTGDGDIAEIQIRTAKMHQEAEYGVASHANYKKDGGGLMSLEWFGTLLGQKPTQHDEEEKEAPEWIKELANTQEYTDEPDEFLNNLKTDFFSDRLFVFTPLGDVIDLPQGSTPIDFAYHVHTHIGNHTFGAKVNGKFTSLESELKNGDIVEIITKEKSHPTTKWLDAAKTTLARRHIKSYLQSQKSK